MITGIIISNKRTEGKAVNGYLEILQIKIANVMVGAGVITFHISNKECKGRRGQLRRMVSHLVNSQILISSKDRTGLNKTASQELKDNTVEILQVIKE